MYNPYFNYPQTYPQFPQQEKPIQNIINTQAPLRSEMFMARYLKSGEDINNIYIQDKTAFIDLTNKRLIIKEPQKEKLEEYEIVIPKDDKDIKIEELEKQVNELKEMVKNGQSNAITTTGIESTTTNGNAKKLRSK